MVSNLVFASNATLSCFFFLIIDLYFLIPAAITQIFIVATELAIPTGIPTIEANAETETPPVTVEAKISKCSYNLKFYKPFCASYLLIDFALFPQ